MAENTSLDARADVLERKMSDELDVLLSKSALFNMADGQLGASGMGSDLTTKHGKYYLMDDDPRLPKMPAKPTLLDYFECRAKGINHMLQSATHALKAGMPEKTILACLLHDIANAIFIKSDHGYWGAQLIEPYVDGGELGTFRRDRRASLQAAGGRVRIRQQPDLAHVAHHPASDKVSLRRESEGAHFLSRLKRVSRASQRQVRIERGPNLSRLRCAARRPKSN
jgi:hypothetical protein